MSQLEPFMTSGPLPPSRHRSTWGRRIVALVAVGVALAMVGLSVFLLRGPDETTDYAGAGTGEVTVIVARGDTLTEIGAKLQEAGVVLSADAFVNAAAVDDRAATIGPGRYTLRKQMSSIEALELMLDPASRADSRLVLPEGLRLEQTVSMAAEATSLPKSDFQKVLQDPAPARPARLGEGPARGVHVPGDLRPDRRRDRQGCCASSSSGSTRRAPTSASRSARPTSGSPRTRC